MVPKIIRSRNGGCLRGKHLAKFLFVHKSVIFVLQIRSKLFVKVTHDPSSLKKRCQSKAENRQTFYIKSAISFQLPIKSKNEVSIERIGQLTGRPVIVCHNITKHTLSTPHTHLLRTPCAVFERLDVPEIADIGKSRLAGFVSVNFFLT